MPAKADIRQKLRKILAEIPQEELSSRSLQACHRLFELPEYIKAETIMVFLSLPTELDTTPLVLRSWQDHKRVLAPKVSWDQRRMTPLEIRSLTDDLAVSQMGIREPLDGVPVPVDNIDLVIMPGLAFDEHGNRLGRGAGFYDRFLSHPEFRAVTCALALEEQVTTTLPVGPIDRPVDMLVTDQKVRRFKPSAPGRHER